MEQTGEENALPGGPLWVVRDEAAKTRVVQQHHGETLQWTVCEIGLPLVDPLDGLAHDLEGGDPRGGPMVGEQEHREGLVEGYGEEESSGSKGLRDGLASKSPLVGLYRRARNVYQVRHDGRIDSLGDPSKYPGPAHDLDGQG